MSIKLGTACLCAALLALAPTASFAGSTGAVPSSAPASKSALAPGGAAGIRKAQDMDEDTLLWVGGAALVIGGIILIASGNGHHHNPATTSTGTP